MCFSATASFVSGTVLSATGGVTIKKAKKSSQIPFAMIPLLFGIQQLIEGVVWISFGTAWLNTAATIVYSIFSHVLWPIFVPFAVLLLEQNKLRRRILKILLTFGIGVGIYLLYFLITKGVTAEIVNNCIAYVSPHFNAEVSMTLYVMASCFSCFISSHKMVKVFGGALFFSFLVSFQFFSQAFFSVWCFFAAVLSAIIYFHFKFQEKEKLE